ncbi:MAG: hypothetical protein M3410_15570 [Acidobacteriota bacterium]|nr:hypothetical protein [Acidobacteriota bacterium]
MSLTLTLRSWHSSLTTGLQELSDWNRKEPLAGRVRKGLNTIMDFYFRYIVIVALIFLAIWIVLKIAAYFVNIIAPAHEIVFVVGDEGDTKIKQAPQVLSAKLRRLQSYSKPPTGYGFLQVPVLGAVPKEAQLQLEPLSNLKDITIKIKDVDVNAIIKAVGEVLSPPRYELRIHRLDLPEMTEVSCDLFYGAKQKANWRSRARKENAAKKNDSPEGNPKPNEQIFDIGPLLDDVLFQMIYDFMTKDEFKAEWGIAMTQGDYQPQNWQTLQAYTRGVQALTAYQQNLDHKDLEEALFFLKKLSIVAPNNAYGLYYYGLALSEDRQEDEAVGVFEQLQRVLIGKTDATLSLSADPLLPSPPAPTSPPPPTQSQPKIGTEKIYYEAKFNEATARLKFYRLEPGERAAKTLADLINELKAKKAEPLINEDDRWYYSKMLAITYAQLAYTHGTILSFLHDRNAPEMTVIPQEIQDRWATIEQNLEMADDEFQVELKDCWEKRRGTAEEQDQLQREKRDIEFRIKNAAGYSLFRLAGYWADLKQIPRFKELCEEAIRKLEEANVARPNHYEVLQNMAMIYEDKVYDPEGAYLDKAESLYLQTAYFVPNDYYQYEHLAHIQWRRIEEGEPATANLIKKGKDYGVKAVNLRPHASLALLSVARFNVKSWENSKDKTTAEAKNAVAEALEYFKRAIAARPNSRTFIAEYATFLLRVADVRTTDANIALEYGSALLAIAKKEAVEAEQKKLLLERALAMLAQALELTKQKNTEELKDINAKAQTLHDEANKLLSSP